MMPEVYGVEDGDDAPNEPDGGAEAAGFHLRIPSNVIFKLAQLKNRCQALCSNNVKPLVVLIASSPISFVPLIICQVTFLEHSQENDLGKGRMPSILADAMLDTVR